MSVWSAWTAVVVKESVLVKTEDREKPENEKYRSVCKRWVILSRVRDTGEVDEIRFAVAYRAGAMTIKDVRAVATGAQAASGGLFKDVQHKQGGKPQNYTPTAWVAEVKHLIGELRARQCLEELDWIF